MNAKPHGYDLYPLPAGCEAWCYGCKSWCRVWKSQTYYPEKTDIFDENFKLSNGNVKEFFGGNEFFGYITTELSVLSFI